MSAKRKSAGRWRGCLEIAGLIAFGIVLGGFAVSTWFQYRSGRSDDVPAERGVAREAPPPVDRSGIRIEVRNGSGVMGAAGRMTEFLREQGFDVVDFGNADRFDEAQTYVVERSEDPRFAREVATALGGVPVESGPAGDPSVDVTVVVGGDVEEVFAADEPEETRSGWRGWLDRLRGR